MLEGRTGLAGPSLKHPPFRAKEFIKTKVVGPTKFKRRQDIGRGHILSKGYGEVGTMKGVYTLYKQVNSNGSPSDVLEMRFFKYSTKRTDSILFSMDDLVAFLKGIMCRPVHSSHGFTSMSLTDSLVCNSTHNKTLRIHSRLGRCARYF